MVPYFIRSQDCKDMLELPHSKRTPELISSAWRAEWLEQARHWGAIAAMPETVSTKDFCLTEQANCSARAAAL